MDIEAVKARCAAAQVHGDDFESQEAYHLAYVDLPDAIELIEKMEKLVRHCAEESLCVHHDEPGCFWCDTPAGEKHKRGCDAAAVLDKIRPQQPVCDATASMARKA